MRSRPFTRSPSDFDARKLREADARRTARIGWLVVCGVALLTAGVVQFVVGTQSSGRRPPTSFQQQVTDFVDAVKNVAQPNTV
ncbi:MAG TPA: hypothetical protein VF384_12300, partial [Planctomycetota bacterium]